MNAVQLIGNLTRDLELTYSNNGFAFGKGSIAVNDKRKKGDAWVDQAHFFEFTLLGKSAESLAQYMLRGMKVGLSGKLQYEQWEKDGVKRSKVTILVSNVDFLTPKAQNEQQGYAPQGNVPQGQPQAPQQGQPQQMQYTGQAPQQAPQRPAPQAPPYAGGQGTFEDDIPF